MRVNEVYEGDCLDVMKQFPDNCIDTILTDPPYGLSFMGKNWDHGLPGIPFWREALRVAKPGATLMAFGGTRTYHRLACAIEDAGWEIRDCVTYLNDGSQAEAALMASLDDEQLAAYLELHYPNGQCHWIYGSGMGLGYDVSKGIDKSKGAEREIVGVKSDPRYNYTFANSTKGEENGHKYGKFNGIDGEDVGTVTAPATPLAAKFNGYRSRLKPAFEPIILAMKPIDKNYAHNAEKWGVSGLNIDGARVETNGESLNGGETVGSFGTSEGWDRPWKHNKEILKEKIASAKEKVAKAEHLGRYPANIIHDSSEQVEAEFAKAGVRTSGKYKGEGCKKGGIWGQSIGKPAGKEYGDTGTPSRYFATCPPDIPRFIYQAKAGKKERATGLVCTRTIKYNIPKDIIEKGGILCKDVSMVLVGLLKKVTLGLTQKWSIDESGESIMGQCPQDSLSTILTEINKTTELRILNWLTPLHIKESTAGANLETANGGNLAENAEYSKRYQQIITKTELDLELLLGVKNVASKMLSEIKKEENWKRETKKTPSHPTQKPLSLIRELAKLTKPPDGGIVLDPFAGSGTTGLAALAEGRDYILIEKEPEYCEIIKRRIAEYTGQEIAPREVEIKGETVKQIPLW